MLQGFNLYLVSATRISRDGRWTSYDPLPTFWVLGGCESDAEKNARTILGQGEYGLVVAEQPLPLG